MKKRILSLMLSFMLIIPAIFMLTACTPSTIEISSYEDLTKALEGDKEVIVLKNDLDITDKILVTRKVKIDLNGKTIKGNGNYGVFYVTNNGDLTITGNGTIIAVEDVEEHYAMAIWAKDNANVTIENGNFKQEISGNDTQYDLIYGSGSAQITILGGKFECHTPQWTLNLKDADNKVAKFIVKGGEYVAYNPADSKTEPVGVSANFVADGYKVELVENTTDTYKVVKS